MPDDNDNIDHSLQERQLEKHVKQTIDELYAAFDKAQEPVIITDQNQEPFLIINTSLSSTFDEMITNSNETPISESEFNEIIKQMFGDMFNVKPRPHLRIVSSNNEMTKSKSTANLRII